MDLKDRLTELRREKGWRQDELALKLNVTRQAVSKWERGAAVPSIDNLVYIGRLYGIPLDELVNGRPQCEEPPSTTAAVEEQPEAAEKRGRPKPLQLAGAAVLAVCILLTAITSFVTLYHVISGKQEKLRDKIVWTDDLEVEDIDLSEMQNYLDGVTNIDP